jgi:hypothetical protein
MRPGNLMKLQIIRCLACYDSGEVIDRFDHSKRQLCECSGTSDQPAGGGEYILMSGTGGRLTPEHHALRGTVKLPGGLGRVAG